MKRTTTTLTMAKIAILLILIAALFSASAQGNLGMNGAGFFENRTGQSDAWLQELGPKILRVPGGAIAKYQNPAPDRGGWGMDSVIIDSITRYQSQEEEPAATLDKWYRKMQSQPDHSYLDELIDSWDELGFDGVIYAINVFTGAEKAQHIIQYLIDHGVPVVGVEMGNETYSQVNHDFDEYNKRVAPIAAAIRDMGIMVYHPAAPSGTRWRKDHNQWNQSLQVTYPDDGKCLHIYYDHREIPCLADPVDTACAWLEIAAWDFDLQFENLKAEFPGAPSFIVTETNTQPSRLIGDTDLSAFFVQRLLQAGSRHFDYFCLHNGVSPDMYGLIYGKEGEQKKNTTFEAFKQVNLQISSPCDTTVTSYDTTYQLIQVIDTVMDGHCIPCERFWYWLFNLRACLKCPTYTDYVRFEEIEIITPVYDITCPE